MTQEAAAPTLREASGSGLDDEPMMFTSPYYNDAQKLEFARGAIRFRNDVIANLRTRLAALAARPADPVEPPHCQRHNMPQTRNPHPMAGDPSLEFGYEYQCIPCLVMSRRGWRERCYEAEKKVAELERATPAEPSVRAALEEWDASAHPAVPPSSSPGPAGLQSAGASEVEIRLNDDGTLDEVVGGEGIHLEQMDTNHWWMAVYYPGGRVTVGFHARGKITANVERER